jgi:WD40 repeat protein
MLRRLDASTGTVEGRPLRVGSHSSFGLSSTGDRRRLFVTSPGDDATWEIDAERLRVLRRFPVGGAVGAVSRDGKLYALGSKGGAVRVLDVDSGAVRRFEGSHEAGVLRLAFTPDGRSLVSSAEDGGLIVWDVRRGAVRENLVGHSKELYGLALPADGRTLYSAALDGRAVIWDIAGDRRLARPFGTGEPFVVEDDAFPKGLAASPDGRTLAVTQSDGTVDLIDARTLRSRQRVRALPGFAAAVDFSPDGRLMAVTGEGGRITLWHGDTAEPAGPGLRGLRTTSQALAFSPDGGLLAAAELGGPDSPGAVMVWNVRSRAPTGVRFRTTSPSLAFSPDGRLIAAAGIDKPTEVRDARTGRLVARLRTDDEGRSVAFSRDGSLLATGLYDGRTQLWSTKTWKPTGGPLEGHEGRVISPVFAPDGRTLATSSADGTIRLWDVATHRQIGVPLTVDANMYVSAVSTPNGSRLFAVSEMGPGVRLELSPQAWERQACLVAGRELSEGEWNDALPGRRYRSVCGS